MTPMMEARAFAIWRFAAPRDWAVTYAEIEGATGLDAMAISHVISTKEWGGRMMPATLQKLTQRSYAAKHRRGERVDENRLDLVDLIGE